MLNSFISSRFCTYSLRPSPISLSVARISAANLRFAPLDPEFLIRVDLSRFWNSSITASGEAGGSLLNCGEPKHCILF